MIQAKGTFGGVDFKIFTGEEPPASEPEGLFVPIPSYTKLAITPVSLGEGDVVVADDVSNLPTRRTTHYACFRNGKFYWVNVVLNGPQGGPHSFTFIVDIYDLASDLHTSVTHTTATEYLCSQVTSVAFGIYEGNLIWAGGNYMITDGSAYYRSNRAGILNLSTGISSRIADMPVALREMSAGVKIGGLIYFHGGNNGTDKTSALKKYDIASNLWSSVSNTTTTYRFAEKGFLFEIGEGKLCYIGYAATTSTGSTSAAVNNSNIVFDIALQSFANISFSGDLTYANLNISISAYPCEWEGDIFFIGGGTIATLTLYCAHFDTAAMETILPASSVTTAPMRVLLGSATSVNKAVLLAATLNALLSFHSQRETNSNHDASKLIFIGEPSDEGTLVLNQRASIPNIVLCDTEDLFFKTGIRAVYFSPDGTLIPVTGVKKRISGEAWTDL